MNRREFKNECLKGIEDITDRKIGETLERFNHTILEEYAKEEINEKEAKWLVEEVAKRYNGEDEVKFYADLKEEMRQWQGTVTSGYLKVNVNDVDRASLMDAMDSVTITSSVQN